jgi:hypothetical protein
MIRRVACVSVMLVGLVAAAAPASAQIVQSLHIGAGVFFPRGFDARAEGDVLVEDLSTFEPLLFNINDFRAMSLFGEWNVSFGPHIEASAGVSYFRRTVPSIYANVTNGLNGPDIEQNLRLRETPITGIVRVLPFGRPTGIQPYVGGGVAVINFRYSEIGDFVDTTDYSIFNNNNTPFIATGNAVGPVVVVGMRMPLGGDIYGLTAEWRYHFVTGDTGGIPAGFLSNKIDLSGGTLNFGFLVRF